MAWAFVDENNFKVVRNLKMTTVLALANVPLPSIPPPFGFAPKMLNAPTPTPPPRKKLCDPPYTGILSSL